MYAIVVQLRFIAISSLLWYKCYSSSCRVKFLDTFINAAAPNSARVPEFPWNESKRESSYSHVFERLGTGFG
jgi:hypothetical protein